MDAESPQTPENDRRTSNDRRQGERRQGERRGSERPDSTDRRKGADRRKGPRRKRSINQYDLSDDVLEFINAINRFKESSGRPFPTWSEVLGILTDLGYEKRR